MNNITKEIYQIDIILIYHSAEIAFFPNRYILFWNKCEIRNTIYQIDINMISFFLESKTHLIFDKQITVLSVITISYKSKCSIRVQNIMERLKTLSLASEA